MPHQRSIGLLIIVLGLALVTIGVMVLLGWFSWFGRLPGDLHIERDRVKVFFPLTSLLLISALLTLVLNLIRRLF